MRFTASTSAHIKAPQHVVFSVLTNYRQYEAWAPDVNRSRLFAREGEVAIAELIAPPYGSAKLVLEFIETPRSSVVFTQVDRGREEGISGRFTLTAMDEGAGTMVKAELGATAPFYRPRCGGRLRQILRRLMPALADRALKLLASGLSDVPDQRAKLLEIEIEGDLVRLRVAGSTYELVRPDGESRA